MKQTFNDYESPVLTILELISESAILTASSVPEDMDPVFGTWN